MAAALALAGCGAGHGPTPDAHPTRQFAAIASSICANADANIEALHATGGSLAALARATAREVPIIDGELTQLAALTPPARERAPYRAALALSHHALGLVARLVAAVRAGDRAQAGVLALRARAADAAAKTAMAGLGLAACAREALPG
ncbi:MAG TPA: hypothetical protein VL977_03690 [Solirubrobacteraceae bacterium]|nr:hypothetical protein [Solirubrobacteraceae bacterium]